MQRRTRNRICIWLIFTGLLNFVVYTVVYAELGGDAKNGGYRYETNDAGHPQKAYYIMGHFIHGPGGRDREVSKSVWTYSYLHSISLWPTQAMIVICLMILARPHIIATMQESNLIRGPTFIVIIITITALLCAAMTAVFTVDFLRALSR
ncbi:MAG: hypothetical protein GXY44_01200 [Phycisphaerales bacterium]|nr:hypothetical protein [Phycisphaerales bacterium]